MYRTHNCGELRINNAGESVRLSGWVQRSRDLGGMTFVDVRDRYGLTQLVFNMEENEDLCKMARKLGREYVIQAIGNVAERSSKNPKMPTGDIEILVNELNILKEAETPPSDQSLEKTLNSGTEWRRRSGATSIPRDFLK